MNSGELEPPLAGGPDWAAIGRYLAGESDSVDAQAVREWLLGAPEEAAAIEALDAAVRRAAERSAAEIDVDAAFAALRPRRSVRTSAGLQLHGNRRSRGAAQQVRWRGPLAIAAAACLFLVLGVVSRGREPMSVGLDRPAFLQTGIGERDTLNLADGSRVIVGPASRIEVRDAGNEMAREIDLNGEALFDVVHDTLRPFVVRAGPALVRDLGTSFAVRYDSAVGVRVVVTEGVVRFSERAGPDSGIQLRAGDAAVLDRTGRIVVSRVDSSEEVSARERGWLVLRDASLPEVAAVVRGWYGLELHVPDDSQLAKRRLTATFTGDPVKEVITMLELALDAYARVEGDTIILRSVRRGTTRR